ncbi:hypothetical protein CCACVL1_25155 [Corchorus capsularis]|uniref:Uncharacterized protein n=1 Tax=Corchorus capsularis TaxID=210143 RepID=A0A1R3GLP9_COCAP|nr:hypothetical protein CCACVL1_25155 [Corchorus capsularis]
MDPARLPAAKENEREKKRKAQEASGAQSKRVAATSSTHDAPSITQRPTLRDREDISSPVGGALGVTPIVPASVASPEPPPSLFDDSAPPASLFDDDSAPIRGFPPGYFRGSFGQWHTEFCAQGAEPSITETVCALLQYDLKPGSVDDANALDQLSPAEIVVFLMISAYQDLRSTAERYMKERDDAVAQASLIQQQLNELTWKHKELEGELKIAKSDLKATKEAT